MINEKILSKNNNYVVAVSGGPDSIFLLYWLVKKGYYNLYVAHVNYNKRKDSKIDEKIVRLFCEVNKLNSYVKSVTNEDYKKYMKIANNNFQNIARIIRYDFFEKIAIENNAKILIAHNLNDLIETYIIQKRRKSIIKYWGIKEKSFYGKNKIEILRPILNLKKSEIINFLKINNINYAIDCTNNSLMYERNKIRKTINDEQIKNYLQEIKKDNKLLEKKENNLKKYYNIIVDENKINIELFNSKITEEKLMIIFKYFENNNLLWILLNNKRSLIKEIVKQLESKKPNIIIHLKKKYLFVKEYKYAFFYIKKEIKEIDFTFNSIEDFKIKNYDIFLSKNQKINLKNDNGYYFFINQNDFPIKFTNKEEVFKNVKINNNTKINRVFIKNKIPLFERKNPIWINKNNELLLIPKYKTISNKIQKNIVILKK